MLVHSWARNCGTNVSYETLPTLILPQVFTVVDSVRFAKGGHSHISFHIILGVTGTYQSQGPWTRNRPWWTRHTKYKTVQVSEVVEL